MTDKIRNFIDAEFEPLTEDKTGPVYGLVVGPKLTEAEFSAKYSGDWRGRRHVIEFEDDPQTSPPGTETEDR